MNEQGASDSCIFGSRFNQNSRETIQNLVDNSSRISQLKAIDALANSRTLTTAPATTQPGVIQRKVEVAASYRSGDPDSVVVEVNGFAPEFKGGSAAIDQGWNNVKKYKADVDVGGKIISRPELENDYLEAQAGHVLASQNGGNGGDSNNVFAQDGGVNNATYRSDFENPMRQALEQAADDADVTFRAVLYGKKGGPKIKKGPLEKKSDRIDASQEDSDWSGFESE